MKTKRIIALKLLAAKGLKRSVYEPNHLRLLWYFGFDTPPPHFASFLSNIAINSIVFSILWYIFRAVFQWLQKGYFQSTDIYDTIFVSAIYGVGMAVYYAYSRRKNELPTWQGLSS